jgi:hypothetical protein
MKQRFDTFAFSLMLFSVAVIVAISVFKTESSSLYKFILDWQTLIAGLVALGGAIMTVHSVRQQISSSEQIDRRRRRAEEYAARALVPLALSALHGYADACLEQLKTVNFERPLAPIPEFTEPEIPQTHIELIRDCIKYADRNAAKEMADMLNFLQVQNSRLRNLGSRIRLGARQIFGAGVRDAYIDSLELYARINRIYDYGRREGEESSGRIRREEMDTAMFGLQLSNLARQEIDKLLDIRFPTSRQS